jgi:hypothetical protein
MKFLALALALFLVPQDEKITLKFSPKKGDKLTQSHKFEVQLKLKIEQGDEVHEIDFEQRGTTKTVREYADVADGKLTKLVLDCTESFKEVKQVPMQPDWNRTDEAMHGRKVTISLKDGQVVREGADGLSEKELKKLDLKTVEMGLLPKDPLAVGESWEVTGEGVRQFLDIEQEVKNAKLKLKLVSVKEIDKRRCAVLTGSLEASGTAENEVEFKITLDCDLVVWIERGYLLSVKGKGKVTLKGGGDQFSMSGDGTATLDVTNKVE